MIELTKKNLKDFTPEQLSDKLSGPGAEIGMQIAEASLPFLRELFGQIIEAIGQRKVLRKRVETLEAAMRAQNALNEQLVKRIEALEK